MLRYNPIQGWSRFYLYSISLGIRLFVNNPLAFSKEAFKRIIIPMDYQRYFEIPATFKELEIMEGERALDLSSPKLLSFYLAEKLRVQMFATDIWRKEIVEWGKIRKYVNNKELNRNLRLQVEDGRRLKYKSNFFDKIFSISVIEHIEGKGDMRSMKEFARVLRRGGSLVITVPLLKKYIEHWVIKDVYSKKYRGGKPLFDHRRYDMFELKKRIIHASSLSLQKTIICKERFPFLEYWYANLLPVSALFGLLFPILAKINLKPRMARGAVSCVLLVFKKL